MRAFGRLVVTATAITIVSLAQSEWHPTEKTDALRGTHYTQFALEGRFLTPPKGPNADPVPRLFVQCLPGEHSAGYHIFTNGRYITSWLAIGSVLDTRASSAAVHFRLDDGKIKEEVWASSTSLTGLFFEKDTLNTLLYGHFLPHKENSGQPVRKLVIATDEYLAGEVVMQFDLPNPAPVAEACGLVVHKR